MAAAMTMQGTVTGFIQGQPAVVRQAIADNATVLAALEACHLLDGLTPEQDQEVRWVLTRLTATHNQTVLDTIDAALEAGLAVEVAWLETAAVGVGVEDGPGRKKVIVQTPMPPTASPRS